jgi:uncharacterized membrane protein
MLHRLLRLLFVWFVLLVVPAVTSQQPVVYGVFFYSPTCPHCHEVITNHWPGIQAQFGDQLQVLFIDVSRVEGSQIMVATLDAMRIESNGVPMLIIGSDVLIGSLDIPLRAPEVIRLGIAAGGVELPPVAALRDAFQNALAQSGAEPDTLTSTTFETANSLGERLAADPFANALAILVLFLLIASLIILSTAVLQNQVRHDNHLLAAVVTHGRRIVAFLALLGLGMALSLVFGWNSDLVVLLIATGEFIVFLVIAIWCLRSEQPLANWVIPVVALAGLAVAAYLTYIETTQAQAVCGVMGNCNAVQQSPYAEVLNIPMGVIGIIGYITIAAVFGIGKVTAFRMNSLLLGLLVFGVAFSAYLTFIEPFVIGATCVWCLTSALLMLMLLWLTVLMSQDVPRAEMTPTRAN